MVSHHRCPSDSDPRAALLIERDLQNGITANGSERIACTGPLETMGRTERSTTVAEETNSLNNHLHDGSVHNCLIPESISNATCKKISANPTITREIKTL